ncbi:hypothetical protein EUX98_g6541 [Antrodiella citrinella]|uniref:Protein-S-isoprenylcysteine O-methyltransferase n=1 Tax=Antrodiella citrinella TaxID=2447956 RepID=A0A4S4MW79_9APHY|nr:hypothetical protein EUX98_g6541 [Antrodiella citrinella]
MEALLSNPAAKIPFLVVNLILARRSSLPPTLPPKQGEKDGYEADAKTRDVVKDWASWYTPTRRRTMHVITFIEILILLSRRYPTLLSNSPLSILKPLLSSRYLNHIRVTPTFLLGSLLLYVGTFIRVACYRTMGRHFTFQLAILPQHKLITSGPYAIVRHPGYTASVLVNLGVILCQVGHGSWMREVVMRTRWGKGVGVGWVCAVSAVSYMLVARIPKEDTVLRREFGAEWEKWAERTRFRLIPGIY